MSAANQRQTGKVELTAQTAMAESASQIVSAGVLHKVEHEQVVSGNERKGRLTRIDAVRGGR